MEYIDLSTPEVQGRFGHDKIDQLKEPGFYKLPFRTYSPDGQQNIVVQVASVFSVDHLSQCIVVYDGDFMWSFYYNGAEQCFKPNWDNSRYEIVLGWIDMENENEE